VTYLAVLLPTASKERRCKGARCMECREVLNQLWEYLDQELVAEEAGAIADHLRRCGTCYAALCYDRAFLDLLARLRVSSKAPASLLISVRAQLRAS
jgi:mycothiol system anti-sigma-R factor